MFGFIDKDHDINNESKWVVEVSGYALRNNKIKDLLLPSQNYVIDALDSKELVEIIDNTGCKIDYIYNRDVAAAYATRGVPVARRAAGSVAPPVAD